MTKLFIPTLRAPYQTSLLESGWSEDILVLPLTSAAKAGIP